VGVHRQAADDEIFHLRVVQHPDNGFNAVDFHDPRTRLAEFRPPASLLKKTGVSFQMVGTPLRRPDSALRCPNL
jgi:hypothetical protein